MALQVQGGTFMKTEERLSIKIIRKVVFVSIVLICLLTIGAVASKSEVNYVTIVYPEDYETTVMTSKVVISEILSENHIIVLPDEVVYPSLDSKLDITKTIKELRYNPQYSYIDSLVDLKKEMRENRFEKLWGVREDYE